MSEEVEKQFPDVGFAVFNNHVNGAHRKALRAIREQFGDEGIKEITRCRRRGIMTIFHTDPTPVTKLYADTCFKVTNSAPPEAE